MLVGDDPSTIQAASFIFGQEPPYPAVTDAPVTINEVERRSQLDLLWQLEDELEEQIESERFEEWAESWVQ